MRVTLPVRGEPLTLAYLGLLLGALVLPLSLDLCLTIAHQGVLVRSLLLFLYPLALALSGLGAVLALRFPAAAAGWWPLRGGGVALLAFLAVTLRANFLVEHAGGLVAPLVLHGLALGAWFLLVGMGIAGSLHRIRRRDASGVASGWAFHLLGLVVGYLGSEPIFAATGVNSLFLAAGVSLLVLPRHGWIALPALICALFAWPLEDSLERLRVVQIPQDERPSGIAIGGEATTSKDASLTLSTSPEDLEYVGWSRYGQMRVVAKPRGRFGVQYNFKQQFEVDASDSGRRQPRRRGKESDLFRSSLYPLLPADGRLLFTGVGGGRGLSHLGFEPHAGVIAVERNPSTVRFFRDVRPDLNGGLFNQITTLTLDGRHAIERQTEPLDAIVLESSLDQPTFSFLPASAPYYLYTAEAIATYLDRLAPGGLLVMEFARTADGQWRRYLPMQVKASLVEGGAQWRVIRFSRKEHLCFVACAEEGCLDPWLDRFDLRPGAEYGWSPDAAEASSYRLRDGTPFAAWATMAGGERRTLLIFAVVLLVVPLLALLLATRTSSARKEAAPWNPVPYFYALGLGHTALQFHAFYAWRAWFGDELRTILCLIVGFLLTGALGSWLSSRLPARVLAPTPRLVLAVALLLLHFLAIELLPHGTPSMALRYVIAAFALLPGGVLAGIYLPLGLATARTSQLGRCLASDALGTLAGYGLVFLVMVPLGLRAQAAVALALYVTATALYRRKPQPG